LGITGVGDGFGREKILAKTLGMTIKEEPAEPLNLVGFVRLRHL